MKTQTENIDDDEYTQKKAKEKNTLVCVWWVFLWNKIGKNI